MHSIHSSTPAASSAVGRVGRLKPLAGVIVRPHPHRPLLQQFLQEAEVPLAALETMLELAFVPELAEPAQMAVRVAHAHAEHLRALVADFATHDRLEADSVTPQPRRVALLDWLLRETQRHAHRARQCGVEIEVRHRSLLPSAVELDADLAAQALGAVLHVAMHRALAGPIDVRVSYQTSGPRAASFLNVEVVTQGGGYSDMELGYVFAPFAVRDGASRPLLGLSIAQRQCVLLDGELTVDSRGESSCSYRLCLAAPPTQDSVWLDPLDVDGRPLGLVRPGRVLFVESTGDNRRRCGQSLRRAGYEIGGADGATAALQLLADAASPCRALVVHLPSCGTSIASLAEVAGLRQPACAVIVLADGVTASGLPPGIDALAPESVDGATLLTTIDLAMNHRKAALGAAAARP